MCSGLSAAQTQPAQPKTLAATMDVYVFPTEGQTAQQQSTDEAACYNWAVQSTGSDPFALQKQAQQAQQQADQAQQQIDQSGKGAGAVGAVGGAAAGALIGEIAGHSASAAAGWGALAGAVIARRRTEQKKAQASEQVEQQNQQAQQATAEQIENFKKAFSVCLEAKDYMVKY
jgi:outer membrane lipoprotein SlyB